MDFFAFRAKVESVASANQFADYMLQLTRSLHKGTVRTDYKYHPEQSLVEWSVQIKTSKLSRKLDILDKTTAKMAEYIVDVKEPQIVHRILLKNEELSSEEKEAVKSICRKFLELEKCSDESKRARISLVAKHLKECLQQFPSIDLDGFIAFRLTEYNLKLYEMVDFAVEEFLLERQYEDFIGLLQYFVYFQEPLTPFIHVMHKQGSEFVILNEGYIPIDSSSAGDVVIQMADLELQMEDMVVSSLISLSPERILLHTNEPEALAVTTICRIFGERVELCQNCSRCRDFQQASTASRSCDQVT